MRLARRARPTGQGWGGLATSARAGRAPYRVKRRERRFPELVVTSAYVMRSTTQEPFAEKRTAEAVFPVVVVDYVLPFKLGDGLFY